MGVDTKITDLTEQTSDPHDDDVFVNVDVDDSTMSASGTDKKYKWSTLKANIKSYYDSVTATLTNKTLTSPKINEDVVVTATATELNVTDGCDATEKVLNTQSKCKVKLGTQQENLTDVTFVKILMDTEEYDVGSDFDTGNYRFVAPVSGYYQINASIEFTQLIADKIYYAFIYVNGASVKRAIGMPPVAGGGNDFLNFNICDCPYVVAGQYIELYVYVNVGANTVDIQANNTSMSVHLLSV